MKPSRHRLRPAQFAVIYGLAALLILLNQADGLAGWIEDIARSGQSRFHLWALDLAADLRSVSEKTGLSTVSRVESKVIDVITPKWEIGGLTGKRPKTTEPAGLPEGPAPVPAPAAIPVSPPADGAPAVVSAVTPPPSPQTGGTTIYDPELQALAIPLARPPVRPSFLGDKPIERVLLTGDSMMIEGIGPPLERYFKSMEGIEVSRKGQYSTGLCRIDFFDWFEFFEGLLAERKPDLVLITLGANDTQDIVLEDRKRHIVATEGWNGIYGERVARMARLAKAAGARILWVGLPIMGREPYNARVKNLNEVTRQACEKEDNCLFWDASASLTDKNGKYSSFITLKDGRHAKVRAADSIHLTEDGGKQMLADLLEDSPYLTAENLRDPGRAMDASYPPAAGEPAAVAAPQVDTPAPPLPGATMSVGFTSSGPDTVAQATVAQDGQGQVGLVQANLTEAVPEPPKQEIEYPIPAKGTAPFGPFALAKATVGTGDGGRTTYAAVVPRKDPGGKLPAIVLLHGAEGDQNFFSKALGRGLVDLAGRFGIILIMPDGGPFGWYIDSPVKADSQMATRVMGEVLPDALARYPIDPERLAVFGISMGGHGAITLALDNPGTFKAVAALSAVIDLESHKSDSTLDRYLRLGEILGAQHQVPDPWRERSAYYLTRKKAASLGGVPVMVTVGLGDKLCLAENRQYDRLLTELGLSHVYRERSGGHDWGFWKTEFPGQLAFLAANL